MRFIGVVLIGLLVGSAFFLPKVSSQLKSENVPAEKTESVISIHAKDRGFPHVNFEDGKNLTIAGGAERNAAPAKLLTSADFDLDGTPDLITVDLGGSLKLYRGNVDSIYPNSAEAKQRRETGAFTDAAFLTNEKSFFLPISPDFLFAGDFNADGHQDILAAAKNDAILHLLAGDGAGNFAGDFAIQIDGQITALTTGEIGRRDGQTDLAVAVLNKKGAQLLVFEHPEGAFKYKPEIIRLLSQANDLAIGNLDEDFYADVAVAGGNKLTVVHGRGQAYPWDLLRDYDIKRPAAISETRVLPFEIAALTVGEFTEKRGDSLAILTTGGTLQTLDSPAIEKPKYSKSKIQNLQSSSLFVPSGSDSSKFAVVGNDSPIDEKTAKNLEAFSLDKEEREKYLLEKNEKFAEELQKLSAEEQKKMTAEGIQHAKESRARAKAGFLKTISPGAFAPLRSWNLQTLASDARLTRAAFSTNAEKLIRVRISGSGKDELAFLDTSAKQIHLFVQADTAAPENRQAEIISFDVETGPAAILPMRLNADALSDLVVLREGAKAPSVVMSAPASIITVNTAASSGGSCDPGDSCSLHQAILKANNSAGADVINFNIGGGGAATIIPTTELREIQDTVTIDGTTQPGFSGTPLIEIKGSDISGAADGLQINASSVVVRGLAINEFKSVYDPETNQNNGGNGISIFNFVNETYSRNNIIEGNFLGTDPTGTIDKGNDSTGVLIFDSDDNTIGGTAAAARNLMSGSGTNNSQDIVPRKVGVGLAVIDGQNTKIKGNYIGTNAFGTAKINNSYGVYFAASNSEFGGDEIGAGNTVSGNGDPSPSEFDPERCFGVGISEETLINLTTGELITRDNNYKGNRIGTNAAGTAALRNCNTGLVVKPLHTAVVGSITETGRNTISGNRENGVYCSNSIRSFDRPGSTAGGGELPPGFCDISGNNIGTDVSGSVAIPNEDRNTGSFVIFFGSAAIYNSDTFSNFGAPGGTSPNACTGFCNLVSGNTQSQGMQRGSLEGLVGVFNNYVGTNKNGTAALPNSSGVSALSAGLTLFGGVGIDDNNAQIPLGNLISGNLGDGIDLFGPNGADFYEYAVRGNYIGTDKTGVTAIPNNSDADRGIAAILTGGGAFFPTIGGTDPLERNIIAGNGMTGIIIGSTVLPSIVNNYIGVNKLGQPLGNDSDGIQITSFGSSLTEANVIANNGRNGVYVPNSLNFNGSPAPQNLYNTIRINSIYNNGALGIDLSGDSTFPSEPDGVTPNDCLDADEKANRLQNFPVLTAPTFNGNGTISVEGALSSQPDSDYTIDFYANTSADPTKYGEGETYIGSKDIRTDETGVSTFLFTSTIVVSSAMKITATATDVFGNTSEFSCAAGLCTPEFTGSSKDELRNLVAEACVLPAIIVTINTDQEDPSPTNEICDVNPSLPGLQCSLRAAITTANEKSGFDYIYFDIPGGGIQTIAPTSALPEIFQPVFINATTQPGYSSTPVIEVRGDNAGESDGLVFDVGSNNSVVTGMTINRFTKAGIVFKSNGNLLEKSFIGLMADGISVDAGHSQFYGVNVLGTDNIIGGDRNGNSANNYIAGNQTAQINIEGLGSVRNKIKGNNIGRTINNQPPTGTFLLGIRINNAGSKNVIGGNTAADTNIITANTGIDIQNSEARDGENTIAGNRITGCDPVGIFIANSGKNTIGGEMGSGENSSSNFLWGNGIGILLDYTGNETFNFLADENKIYGNFIGTSPNLEYSGNNSGIVIDNGVNNFIGSGQPQHRNIISGNNTSGISLRENAKRNVVQGNYIGTDAAGTSRKPNSSGITIQGVENQVTGNVISGNSNGVTVINANDASPNPVGNIIQDNRIGIAASGNNPVRNDYGVALDDGTTTVRNNIISGNTEQGIIIRSNGNTIDGNKIGTDSTGNSGIGNTEIGIYIAGSGNTVTSNTISGNKTGINITLAALGGLIPSLNIVQRNFIGTNTGGSAPLPNTEDGILLGNQATDNKIGGTTPGLGNVISGNGRNGIRIEFLSISGAIAPFENKIQGNFIGTDASGNADIGNTGAGIEIINGISNRIGSSGTDIPAARNIISGNGGDGVKITGTSVLNRISGNFIGTKADGVSALGNTGNGVLISNGASSNIIGGTEQNAGNTIAFNAGGVILAPDAGTGNLIDPNSIFANLGLGIDLNGDGIITPNDLHDPDTGPNNLQNYPEIASRQVVGGDLIIGFKVDSAPTNSDYGANGIYVEFFKADPSGEGEKFLGFGYYAVADYNGGSPLVKTVNLGNAATLGITAGDRITATATDASGNTSEFTPTLAPTAANVSISGRILSADGMAVVRARISITDANGETRTAISNSFGYYKFPNVGVGQTYVISVRHKKYQFEPPRILMVMEELTDVDFTLSPES